MNIQDYQKVMEKKKQSPMKQAYQAQVQNIDQQANQQSQQAYIMNEKLKQYLGVVNSSYGQQDISQTGKIQVANNLSQNMGTIQQNAAQGKNDAHINYLNVLENQRLTQNDRNYQQGLINDQRAYEQSLYDKQYKDSQSSQRVSMVQESIYNEYASILNGISSNKKVDTESVKQKLMDVVGKYGQYLNTDDIINIELYIDSLLSSATTGTGVVKDNIVSQSIQPQGIKIPGITSKEYLKNLLKK